MTSMPSDIFSDLERLRLPFVPVNTSTVGTPTSQGVFQKPKAKKIAGGFLKGPIPLPWLSAATRLPGKSPLSVALAIWFEAGRRKSMEVTLTTAILQRFSVNRKAKYRALSSLENAGLVRVYREPRRNPVVTILEFVSDPKGGDASQCAAGFSPPNLSHQLPSD